MVECCNSKIEKKVRNLFDKYGVIIANNPIPVIVLAILFNGLLGIFVKIIQTNQNFSEMYLPTNTQTASDAQKLRNMLHDNSNDTFFVHQLVDDGLYGSVIFTAMDDNIINHTHRVEIMSFHDIVLNITIKNEGHEYSFDDICRKNENDCVVEGSWFLKDNFWTDYMNGNMTYPTYGNMAMGGHRTDKMFGSVNVSDGILKSATSLRFTYYLRHDTTEYKIMASKWEQDFMEQLSKHQRNVTGLNFILSTSNSLENELASNTVLIPSASIVVIFIMATFVFLTTFSGDCLTQRGHLGIAGVLSALLSITGSFGLCAAMDVEYVNMVGIMPFIILGVGMNHVFMMLSALTDARLNAPIEERICHATKTCCVPITISAITNFLGLMIGLLSELQSMRNFCIYTGIAVILLYINQITFFLACMILHERRIKENRHSVTFRILEDGRLVIGQKSKLWFVCCYGRPVKNKSGHESYFEKPLSWVVPKIVLSITAKVIILLIYITYIGLSLWGCTTIPQNVDVTDILSVDSYHHKFLKIEDSFRKCIPISFNFEGPLDYSDANIFNKIDNLINTTKQKRSFGKSYELNWLKEFNKSDIFVTNRTMTEFIQHLDSFISNNPIFKNDIGFSANHSEIIWSRIHFMTEDIRNSYDKGLIMEEVRQTADESLLNVFAYGPEFAQFEQYVSIVSKTMTAIAIGFVICSIVLLLLMPHLLLAFFVILTIPSSMVGIIGIMSLLNLSLDAYTMVYLCVCLGFTASFSSFVCYFYMLADEADRTAKASCAIMRTCGPILHSGLCALIGLGFLVLSETVIFTACFKLIIMSYVVSILHSIFVIPSLLSLFGPLQKNILSYRTPSSKKMLFPNQAAASWTFPKGGVNATDD